jgi:hypothetical protein
MELRLTFAGRVASLMADFSKACLRKTIGISYQIAGYMAQACSRRHV